MALIFPGRLGIQQRVLPHYRAGFFDALAKNCTGGLSVVAGYAGAGEAVTEVSHLRIANFVACRNLHLLTASSPFYLLWQKGLLHWLTNLDPDLLVVEANHRYLSTRFAIRWMHTRGRPVVGWGLGVRQPGGVGDRFKIPAHIQECWSRRLLDSCDGLISYSKKGVEEYHALGFPVERVFHAPNTVIPRPTWPLPSRPIKPDGQAVVLFVGRLQARKRIDNLLKACANLPDAIQPKVLIVGDGPARSELEVLANSIYPRAEFLGALHGDQVKLSFESADLFVLPGTGGLAVQEAMAYGLPVVVAEGDGTQNDLVHPQNGWLIRSNDIRALTAALQEALSNPSRLRLMGRESYRIVSEEINMERMVELFVKAINSIYLDKGIKIKG
jgi:glycosyltransferase involved in cell wall biosynthesis